MLIRTALFITLFVNLLSFAPVAKASTCPELLADLVKSDLKMAESVTKKITFFQKMIERGVEKDLTKLCQMKGCARNGLTSDEVELIVANNIERVAKIEKGFGQAKAYAGIVSVMVVTSVIQGKLIPLIPQNFNFLSNLISIFAAYGIYVVGEPILSPLTSWLRKKAFNLQTAELIKQASAEQNHLFEQVWKATQEKLSINAQMSRNIVGSYIQATVGNFIEMRRFLIAGDFHEASVQLSSAIMQLSDRYPDLLDFTFEVKKVLRPYLIDFDSEADRQLLLSETRKIILKLSPNDTVQLKILTELL